MTGTDYAALVREHLEESLPDPVPRDPIIRNLPSPARFNLVHIITGMRRSGKTFYLFQLMWNLLAQGVPRRHLFYFDFSDDRLKPFEPDTMDAVLAEYRRQVPDAFDDGCYLFLDEVQEADNWQGFCQRVAENENVTMVITGSSSKVSSSEIATTFRGRSHVHEMLPLSFFEYCRFHQVPLPEEGQDAFSPAMSARYESTLDDYLIWGGFPGIQRQAPEDRIEILQSYVRDVVARDVAERAGREDISLTMQLALFAIRNSSCELSTNDLVKRLSSIGYKVYWDKVDGLLGLLRAAYLVHDLPEYTTALKPSSTSVPKVYAEDQGLVYATSRANQQDHGKRLETAIYLELRRRLAGRRTDTVTSLSLPGERGEKVDFLVGDALGTNPYELIQVTYDMSADRTRRRELSSLAAGMRFTGLERGVVVSLREEGTVQTDAGTIDIIPAWKWLLAKG